MKRITVVVLAVIMLAGFTAQAAPGGQTIMAARVDKAPVVDGSGADKVWMSAPRVVTHDNVADIDISLQAVHTGTDIYFLVTFPDKDESRMHKSWVWDKEKKIYTQGNDREDVFVFKWNMGSKRLDLSLTSDDMYEADIWYWKAVRTDPAGYADDKMHHIITENIKDAAKLTSKKGITRYLIRPGDAGTPAFKSTLQVEYAGDVVPRFTHVTPSGSAGDVQAKGQWKDGMWTIEFSRALNTGNTDDVAFNPDKAYQFGVSRYEIAGREPDPQLTQPLYGSGDISEDLTLTFGK